MTMTNRKWRLVLLGVFFPVGLVLGLSTATTTHAAPLGNRVLSHALDVSLGRAQRAPHRQALSSGVVYAALQASGELAKRTAAVAAPATVRPPSPGAQGCQNVFPHKSSSAIPFDNVRVNQDCSLRRQAEEVIAVNPTDPYNLIAGQNDSRIGFNHCGYDWSFDGGHTWGDQLPPFYQFILQDGHVADVCSDPTVTFDAAGNAYAGGVLFDINSAASAIVVTKSNAGIGGAFYHTPAMIPYQLYQDNPLGVVANDNNPNIFHDKELIVADANAASPKANHVYAAWTRFDGSAGDSPIYFSQSTDGGATWSNGIEISGANASYCTFGSGEANPNACDQDQGAHPVVAPNGTVYVAFGNGNTPLFGLNQHLVVSCPVADDCSQPASWTAPMKISDDHGTQPFGPIAASGCQSGDQCLPPNGYRMDDFVDGSLSVDRRGYLYFVWADFRNAESDGNCVFSALNPQPPCNNDVFYSYSTNGGTTWTSAFNLTGASRFGKTAQWQPWSAVTANGKTLWVAFYDRSYGNCEVRGCNDVTLAAVRGPTSPSPSISYNRLTTSSMPNLVPANNPTEAGFLGDYMWVTVDAAGNPYAVWADTRGLGGAVEEDVYVAVPPLLQRR